jgi:hypothetical protein
LIATAREIARLDFVYLAEIGYGGVLVAMVAASILAQARRQAPGRLLMVLLGVALLATGIASAPQFAPEWLLPLMLAGQILYSVLALQCHRVATEDEDAQELNGALARSALPLLIVPWALAFASHLSSPREDVLRTFMVASALAASLQAQWLVPRTRFWPNWLSPVGFFWFGALLFHETLLHIDRNAWDVAFELIALAYLVETARFLSVAETEDARWFGYAAIAAVACVTAAMVLRWFGPPGTLTIAALNDMLLPAIVSLLWAAIGALLTWLATRTRSRTLWSLGALLLIAAAAKLILFDFGSLGELGNILATIAAGGLFLLVAWLAPFPPKSEPPPTPEPETIRSAEGGSAAASTAPESAPAPAPAHTGEGSWSHGRGWIWVLVIGGAIYLYSQWMTQLERPRPIVPPRPVSPVPLPHRSAIPRVRGPSPAQSVSQAPSAVRASPPMDVCWSFAYSLPPDYIVLAVSGPEMQAATEPFNTQHTLSPLDLNVRPGPQAVVLALSATRPTLWRIHQAFPDQVVGVVLSGTYHSNITGVVRAIPVLHAAQEDHSYCGDFRVGANALDGADRFISRLLAHTVNETLVLGSNTAAGTPAADATPQRLIDGASGNLEIVGGVYWSPRNHRSFDLGPALKARCGTARATCAISCGSELAGDPDPGQSKNCDIEYRCGDGSAQTVEMQEGHIRQLVCP